MEIGVTQTVGYVNVYQEMQLGKLTVLEGIVKRNSMVIGVVIGIAARSVVVS